MADKHIGALPQAESLDRESLLVVEQQGEAKALAAGLLQDYAREGVNAYVTAAQEAAAQAAKAAEDAQKAADAVQDVTDDAAAAVAAAQAAESARAAAVAAATAAEHAAAIAAERAVAEVETDLRGYVIDAEAAKNAAVTAAEYAAADAVENVEARLSSYVDDAEQAKTDAQNAAGNAAQDAVNAADAELAAYVVAAQAAQRAAEQARDEAKAIAGGDFLPLAGGTMTGDLKVPNVEVTGVIRNGVNLNVANSAFTQTKDEIVVKTKIPYTMPGLYMPAIRLWGYAYGNASPVDMSVVFYPYNGYFTALGCTSTCPWKPTVKVSTYIDPVDGVEYCAVSFIGSIYYCGFIVDYYDILAGTRFASGWTVETNLSTSTGVSIVPQEKLQEVPYKPIANDIIGSAVSASQAASAIRLATARKINGVPFDGTQDIDIDAVSKTGDETIGGLKTFTDYQRTLIGDMAIANDVTGFVSSADSNIGCLCITLPAGVSAVHLTVELASLTASSLYVISLDTATMKARVGSMRTGETANISAALNSSGVPCILLGNTATVWGGNLRAFVSKVIVVGSDVDVDLSGMTLSLITSEAGFTNKTTATHNESVIANPWMLTTQVPIVMGGTGANNEAGARTKLGVYSKEETDTAISNAVGSINTLLDAINGEVV